MLPRFGRSLVGAITFWHLFSLVSFLTGSLEVDALVLVRVLSPVRMKHSGEKKQTDGGNGLLFAILSGAPVPFKMLIRNPIHVHGFASYSRTPTASNPSKQTPPYLNTDGSSVTYKRTLFFVIVSPVSSSLTSASSFLVSPCISLHIVLYQYYTISRGCF